jgi:hypothetical protein
MAKKKPKVTYDIEEHKSCSCICHDRQDMWECARGYCGGTETITYEYFKITKQPITKEEYEKGNGK